MLINGNEPNLRLLPDFDEKGLAHQNHKSPVPYNICSFPLCSDSVFVGNPLTPNSAS